MNRLLNFFKGKHLTLALVSASLLIGAALAIVLTDRSIKRLYQTAQERFDTQTEVILAAGVRQFEGATTTLRSLQGFFAGSEEVTREEFNSFIQVSKFHATYPGFSTFAYIPNVVDKEAFLAKVRSDQAYADFSIKPDQIQPAYWPILYLEPENTAQELLGIDQFSEPTNLENMARARDLGDLSVSDVLMIAPAQAPGVIIAAPLYTSKAVPTTLEQRRELFAGAVTLALYIDKFFTVFVPIDDLGKQGFSMIVSGRTGTKVQIISPTPQTSRLAKLYGRLQRQKTEHLGENTYFDFTFETPVTTQLTRLEALEPFLYPAIFLIAALFMILVVLIAERVKTLNELRSRYQFITTLSHQLRTPITVLRWGLESLKGKHTPEQKNLLKTTYELNAIIQQMMLFLEMTGELKLHKKTLISLDALCERVLQFIPYYHNPKRINKKCKDGKNIKIWVDIDKLSLAIAYLLDNALTYSNPQSPVTLEITVTDKIVQIKVADQGIGIPLIEQKKIFTEFFRGSNASLGKNAGSGVSLFIAKKIVAAHGGTISFTSVVNQGSVFVITMPATINNN